MTITSRKSKKYGLGYEGFSSNLLHQNNYFKNFTVPGSFSFFSFTTFTKEPLDR